MMDETSDKYAAPPAYESTGADYSAQATTTTTTTTHQASATDGIGFQKGYLLSIPGILKIVEIVCSLLCLILGGVYGGLAAGWCGFVAGLAFFTALIWFIFYVLNIVVKLHPIMTIVEFIYYVVITLFFLIAAIVAAAFAAGAPVLGAYAFFAFIATAAFGVDTFFQFKKWRGGVTHTSHTTTTTTTHTSDVRY